MRVSLFALGDVWTRFSESEAQSWARCGFSTLVRPLSSSVGQLARGRPSLSLDSCKYALVTGAEGAAPYAGKSSSRQPFPPFLLTLGKRSAWVLADFFPDQ